MGNIILPIILYYICIKKFSIKNVVSLIYIRDRQMTTNGYYSILVNWIMFVNWIIFVGIDTIII